MSQLLFVSFFFCSLGVLALTQQLPEDCIAKKERPCSVLALKKSEFVFEKTLVYSSHDTLFEIQDGKIYLIRGVLWVLSAGPYKVVSAFGEASVEKGSLWAEVNKGSMVLKSLKNSMAVTPRGYKEGSITLAKGFETRFSFVEQNVGVAEHSIPSVIRLQDHLRIFSKVFPYHRMNYKQVLYSLGHTLNLATKLSARWHQGLVERRIASLKEQEQRRKSEIIRKARLESYLRKVFRQKNNFEEP